MKISKEVEFCKKLFLSTGRSEGLNILNYSNLTDREKEIINCRLLKGLTLKEAIHQDGEATRSLMQQNLIQDLRDKLADSKAETFATGLTTAQVIQTNTLENFIRQILTPATPAATT